MTSFPRDVLLEVAKWLSLEERMICFAVVCKFCYELMHESVLWRNMDTDAEFSCTSFNAVFRHAKDLRHLGFRHSQRLLTYSAEDYVIERNLKRCCNLTSLDLRYNTSVFYLDFLHCMPLLKVLDITGCQNINVESIRNSLNNKRGLEIFRMANCFQVDEYSFTNIVIGLPDVKLVDADYCGAVSVEQALHVLQNSRVAELSFSPNWGPPPRWVRLLNDFSHITFGSLLLDQRNRMHLVDFLYEDERAEL